MLIRQIAVDASSIRRNDRCPCGSALRYKHCCGADATPVSLERARALTASGRYRDAAVLARAHVDRHPDDPAGLTELGLALLHAGQVSDAVVPLRRAVELAPDDADRHFHLAIAIERIGRDQDAMDHLNQALDIDPDHPAALERLGNLLTKYGYGRAAAACHRRLAELEPDTLPGRLSRAKLLAEEATAEETEASLRQTLALFPTSADAKRLLATNLQEQGRFAEATPLLEDVTRARPTQAAVAYLDLANAKKITPADQPLLDRMRALLRLGTLPETHHPYLHFGLGKAYDDLGDHERAMHHFDTANGIVRRREPFDRDRFAEATRQLIGHFTADHLRAHDGMGSPSEVPILIVGMPRSGTTLVEHIISCHRGVAAAGELDFWSREAEAVILTNRASLTRIGIARLANEYEAVLRRFGPDSARVTDKAPSNFLWVGLIRTVFPRARVIHCLRHPVDTCLSNYFTGFGQRVPFAYDKGDLAHYYRHQARLMDHWRNVLPASHFHQVRYERLVTEPEPVIRSLIEFCGLDWDAACLAPEANRRRVRTASLWQVRQPISGGSTERWRRYEPWLGELRPLLDGDLG